MKRKIILSISLVAILLLSVWLYERCTIWFAPRIEEPYKSKIGVHNIQLTFGNKGTSERIVTWQNGEKDSLAILRYTITGSKDTSSIKPIQTHFIKWENKDTLSNCIVDHFYYSAIIPTTQYGTYSYSINNGEWYEFNHSNPKTFTALCLGDIQTKEAISQQLLDSIVAFSSPDFIIQVGDLIDRPFMKFWDIYFEDFKHISPHIPMVAVLGNHDYGKFPNKVPDNRFFLTFPYFSDPRHTVDTSEPIQHTLVYGDVSFHLFDSNRFFNKLRSQAKDYEEKHTRPENYHLALIHHPPYSTKSWWNNIDVRCTLVDAMRKGGVDLVIAGHEHTCEFRTPNLDDDIPFSQSVSHLSSKNYADTQQNTRTFALLKYNGEKLSYEIYNEHLQLIEKHPISAH